jgi:Mg2+-importing ATPase
LFRSLPCRTMAVATLLVVLAALALPLTPLAGLLGFVPLPLSYYGVLLAIVLLYVLSAEMAKKVFYRRVKG